MQNDADRLFDQAEQLHERLSRAMQATTDEQRWRRLFTAWQRARRRARRRGWAAFAATKDRYRGRWSWGGNGQ